MIIRARFTKRNYLKYLSHLDLIRLFQRSFTAIKLPIKYSQGFNPHPKFSIAAPLSLGIESECEYMDIEITEYVKVDDFLESINKVLPDDIQITNALCLEKETSISAILTWAFYEIKFELNSKEEPKSLSSRIDEWLGSSEIILTRLKKKGKKKVATDINILPLIGNVIVKGCDENNYIVINTLLKTGQNGNIKPVQLMEAMSRDLDLNLDLDSLLIKRLALYAEEGKNIYSPL
ncbi:MAG: DUF2344 domain-containing protein [Tissierellia bacterium]|nr:DUF2344 domain-containing protein [Tissierellia bacterium]